MWEAIPSVKFADVTFDDVSMSTSQYLLSDGISAENVSWSAQDRGEPWNRTFTSVTTEQVVTLTSVLVTLTPATLTSVTLTSTSADPTSEGETDREDRGLSMTGAWSRLLVSLFILGINFLTIITFCRVSQLRTKSNMLVVSLATTDLLVGVAVLSSGLTWLLKEVVHFGDESPCAFRNGLILLACSVSILNISLISLERYFYIVHPYLHLRYAGRKTLGMGVAVIWVMGVAYGLTTVFTYRYSQQYQCQFYYGLGPIISVYIPFGLFVVSGTVTLSCYSLIARLAFQKRKQLYPHTLPAPVFVLDDAGAGTPVRASAPPGTTAPQTLSATSIPTTTIPTQQINFALRSSLRSLKAPLVVFGVFFVTWAPHMTMYVLHDMCCSISRVWRSNVTNLALANSALNFFVYLIFNPRFRKAVLCRKTDPVD